MNILCEYNYLCELPDVQAGFRKGRGTRDQIANIHWIMEKAREFEKNIYFCFTDYAKAFDCVGHNKLRLYITTLTPIPTMMLGRVASKGIKAGFVRRSTLPGTAHPGQTP